MDSGKIKAVIFDMDGVLIDSEPHHLVIERGLFQKLGLTVSEDEHKSYLGKSTLLMWMEVKEKHETPYSYSELAAMNKAEIINHFSQPGNAIAMPGVKEALESLRETGIPMAVASSAAADIITLILEGTGLKEFFLYANSCDTAGRSKPAPDVYLNTSGLLGVVPRQCLVVEDSPNGIRAAKAAGMHCVEYLGISAQPCGLADVSVSNFYELNDLIKRYI